MKAKSILLSCILTFFPTMAVQGATLELTYCREELVKGALDSLRTETETKSTTALVQYNKKGPTNQPKERWENLPSTQYFGEVKPSWRPDFKINDGFIVEPDPKVFGIEAAAFNPTAVVVRGKDGKQLRTALFVRGEDNYGRMEGGVPVGIFHPNGTSRVLLYESNDLYGNDFKGVAPIVVLQAEKSWEMPGGVEDPRIVEFDTPITDGRTTYRYAMTYTAYDGIIARSAIVYSNNLISWSEHRLIFKDDDVKKNPIIWNKVGNTKVPSAWTKSCAILNTKINGKYIMYFGEGKRILMATSTDGFHWDYPTTNSGSIFATREGYFDGSLVEPAMAFLDKFGLIHLYYNGDGPPDGYQSGEIIFKQNNPTKIIYRSEDPFIGPVKSPDTQVGSVTFLSGRTEYDDGTVKLWLGIGDNRVASATGKSTFPH